MDISDDDFEFLKNFLAQHSGYHLTPAKKYFLESRMKRVMEDNNIETIAKIVALVRLNPTGELAKDVIEKMTVNETFFFRDDSPFRVFQDEAFPYLEKVSREEKIKIWSAACSTGQEPYSIHMLLDKKYRYRDDFTYEIHASDISNAAVQKAREGVFTDLEVNRGLPEDYKHSYFKKDPAGGWRIEKECKEPILFFHQNLCDDKDNFRGPYHIVFLRNVLIYFDQETKRRVLHKVAKSMKQGGFLFLGTSENIYDADSDFERLSVITGVYRKK